MASLKHFLLCPFLFLCLSYTFANEVLGFGPRAWPLPEPSAGPGTDRKIHNVRAGSGVEGGVSGPKAGPGSKLGISVVGVGPKPGLKGGDSTVNEVGIGATSEELPPGFGGPRLTSRLGGYWPSPRMDPYNDCTMGYVCPAMECSKYSYGRCGSYNFHPMVASTDLHEVNINWAKTKPVSTAQHVRFGPPSAH